MEHDPNHAAGGSTLVEQLLKLRKENKALHDEIRTLKNEKQDMKSLLIDALSCKSIYIEDIDDREIVLAATNICRSNKIISLGSKKSKWKNDPKIAHNLFYRGVEGWQWSELSAICKADAEIMRSALRRGEIKLRETDPGNAPLAPPGWKRNGTFLDWFEGDIKLHSTDSRDDVLLAISGSKQNGNIIYFAVPRGKIPRDDELLKRLAKIDPHWSLQALVE